MPNEHTRSRPSRRRADVSPFPSALLRASAPRRRRPLSRGLPPAGEGRRPSFSLFAASVILLAAALSLASGAEFGWMEWGGVFAAGAIVLAWTVQ